MRPALVLLAPLVVAACLPSDPVQNPAVDAAADTAQSDGAPVADAAPSDGGQAETSVDGGGTVDGSGSQDFCTLPANATAAFCDDFEKSVTAGDKWDTTNVSGSGTLTLDPLAKDGAKAAAAKLVGAAGQAYLSTKVAAGSAKSKVVIDFDGYLTFTNTNSGLFLTLALRSGSNTSTQYFLDIERTNGNWEVLLTGTAGTSFPSVSEMVWHHFRISYDGSGATGDIGLFIDNSPTLSISRPKGTPPTGAPATFDNVILDLGADKAAPGSTSFHFDNVVVRYL